jgi:hypothetical protein
MYKNMDDKLKDLKFFLRYHYEDGATKRELVGMLVLLDDEKEEILKEYSEQNIEDMKLREQKKHLLVYLNKILVDIDAKMVKKEQVA